MVEGRETLQLLSPHSQDSTLMFIMWLENQLG